MIALCLIYYMDYLLLRLLTHFINIQKFDILVDLHPMNENQHTATVDLVLIETTYYM